MESEETPTEAEETTNPEEEILRTEITDIIELEEVVVAEESEETPTLEIEEAEEVVETSETPQITFAEDKAETPNLNTANLTLTLSETDTGKADGESLTAQEALAVLTLETTEDSDLIDEDEGFFSEMGENMKAAVTPGNQIDVSDYEGTKEQKVTAIVEEVLDNDAVDNLEKFLDVTVKDSNGNNIEIPAQDISFMAGSVMMVIEPQRSFTPGKYEVTVEITNPITGETEEITQDLQWGVLTINTHKDVYAVGETAQIAIGILDDRGAPVCLDDTDDITLKVDGVEVNVENTGVCSVLDPGNITPDYRAEVTFDTRGSYNYTLTADNGNGTREVKGSILVEDAPSYQIMREAATRLYPLGEAPMTLEIGSQDGFTGTITDTVPESFEIKDISDGGKTKKKGDTIEISWEVDVEPGSSQTLSYNYDAPDVSPAFYTVGPLQIGDTYTERRVWQIAGDVTPTLTSFSSPTEDGTYLTNADVIVCADYDRYLKEPSTMDVTLDTGAAVTVSLDYDPFSITGKIIVDENFRPSNPPNTNVHATTVQLDGKILVGGDYVETDTSTFRDSVIRYLPNGDRDPEFGLEEEFTGTVRVIVEQPDGKILVGGSFLGYNNNANLKSIARLNHDGTIDDTFQPPAAFSGGIYDIFVQDDGKILVGGQFQQYNNITGLTGLARLTSLGAVDPGFTLAHPFNGLVRTIEVQNSNGYIVAGGSFSDYDGDFGENNLARITNTGAEDPTFDLGPAFTLSSEVYDLAIQPDDEKIIIGGAFTHGTSGHQRVDRLLPSGLPDATWAGVGVASIAQSVIIDSDGKVIIAGEFTGNVVRRGPNGANDPTFEPDATLIGTTIKSASLGPDGSIVLGGFFENYKGEPTNDFVTRLKGEGPPAGTTNRNQLCGTYTVLGGHTSTDLTVDSIDVQSVQDIYGDALVGDVIPVGENLGDNADLVINPPIVSPGGVSGNLSLWLKANDGTSTTTDGSAMNAWSDRSGSGLAVTQTNSANQPLFQNNAADNINFNPVVDFDGATVDGDVMNIASNSIANATSNYSIRFVAQPGEVAINTLLGNNVDAPDGSMFYVDVDGKFGRFSDAWVQTNNPTVPLITPNNSFEAGGVALGGSDYDNARGRDLYTNGSVVISDTATNHNAPNGITFLGKRSDAFPSPYIGGVAEVIAYDETNSAADLQKIDSYLALKYGVTLNQSSPLDYLATDGSPMWVAADNGIYNNNITGIGRDDDQALDQRISKSVNYQSLLTFSLDDDFTSANNAATRTTAHAADLSFMTWANTNSNRFTNPSWTVTGAPIDRQVVNRSWKIDEVGTVGNVYLSVPDDSSTEQYKLPTEAQSVYLLTKTTDDDFSTGATEIEMVLSGDQWELPGTAGLDFVDAQYFTFATVLPKSPGGVLTNLSLWLKADVGVSEEIASAENASATNLFTGTDIQQTFTAGFTEVVHKVSIGFAAFSGGEFNLNIRDGGTVGAGAILSTQNIGVPSGDSTFILDTPVALTAGNQYTIELEFVGGSSFVGYRTTGDDYSGGEMYIAAVASGQDLNFTVIANPSPASDGDTVNTWLDQGINGLNATTVAGTPTYQSNLANAINFNPTVDFDGSSYLATPSTDLGSFFSFFTVESIDETSTNVLDHGLDFLKQTSHFAQGSTSLLGYPTTTDSSIATMRGLNLNGGSATRYIQDGKRLPSSRNFTSDGSVPYGIGALGSTSIHGAAGDNPMNGRIAEVVVYNSNISTAGEQERIQAYLALKYGLTYYQGDGAVDYEASDGTVMWDATAAGDYNSDIAGIGRDDGSALSQVVSGSINDDALVKFALDNDFASLNNDSSRSAHATDLSFMTWGNNRETGDGLALTTIGAPTNRAILNRAWKVSESGSVGTVFLTVPADNSTATVKLPSAVEGVMYLLTKTTDDNFSSGATETALTLVGDQWQLPAGIDLADKEYFTFATGIPVAPGGVLPDLSLWLKADSGTDTTVDGDPVNTWTDAFDGTVANAELGAPLYALNQFNGNPGLNFGGISDFNVPKDGTMDGQDSFSLFSVQKHNPGEGGAILGSYTTTPVGSYRIELNDTVYGRSDYGPNNALIGTIPIDDGAPHITLIERIRVGTWKSVVDGVAESGTNNASGATRLPEFNIGSSGGDLVYGGHIAEVITYREALDATQEQQVNSYLSLKYGITLDSGTVDYLASDTSIKMWDATVGSSYNNDIFGIGRDDGSSLSQVQSKSVNSDAVVTILAEAEGTNAVSAYDDLDNREFLTVGNDDGGGGAPGWSTASAPSGYTTLNREWSVQENNGDTGGMQLDFDVANGTFDVPALVAGSTYYFLYDLDNDGDLSDECVAGGSCATPSGIVSMTDQGGDVWQVTGINFDSGQEFTLASENGFDISGEIYYDEDGAGDKGLTETTRLQDVTITLYNDVDNDDTFSAGDTVFSTQDSAATTGSYTFSAVPPGEYVIVVDQADPALNNLAANGSRTYGVTTPGEIPLTLSATTPDQDFGFDQAEVAFTTTTSAFAEAASSQNIGITLSLATQFSTTIPYLIGLPSTATDPDDYTDTSPGSVSITAGSTTTSILLDIIADTLVEGDEEIFYTLGTPVGAVNAATNQAHTVTITDDEFANLTISIAGKANGAENFGGATTPVEFTVSLDGGVTNDTDSDITGTVTYTGIATSADYDSTGQTTFTIPNGQSSVDILLPVTEDTEIEGAETVIATISSPSVGTLGTDSVTASIADDDAAVSLTDVTIASDNANPALATVGDTITVSFTSDVAMQNIEGVIATKTASISGGPTEWTVSYVVESGDPQGAAAFAIDGESTAGTPIIQVIATTDGSEVVIDTEAPDAPTIIEPTPPTPFINPTPLSGSCQVDAAGGTLTVDASPDGGLIPDPTIVTPLPATGDYDTTLTWDPSADGTEYTLTLTCTDEAGNVGPPETIGPIVVDLTNPTVQIKQADTQDDPTNSGAIQFTATFSEEMDPTTFTGDDVDTSTSIGVTVGSITIEDTGDGITFTITINTTGEGTLIATIPAGGVEDLGGNLNEISDNGDNEVTIDTEKPDTPPTPFLQPASDSGHSPDDNNTNVTTPIFDVECPQENFIITLYVNGVANGTHTCAGTGTEGAQIENTIDDGVVSVTYTVTDRASNESDPSDGLGITVDTIKPPAQTILPELHPESDTGILGDNKTSHLTPKFNVECTEVGAFVILYQGTPPNGIEVGRDDCETVGIEVLTVGPDELTNGDLEFYTTIEDPAGNAADPTGTVEVGVQSGALPPITHVTDLVDASDTGESFVDNETGDITPTFEVQCRTAGNTITLYIDGNERGTYECQDGDDLVEMTVSDDDPVTPNAPNQSFTTDYKETDVYGNESQRAPGVSVLYDTTAPIAPTVKPDLTTPSDSGDTLEQTTDDITNVQTPTIDVECTEDGETAQLYNGADLVGEILCSGTGPQPIEIPTDLADGVYIFTSTMIDEFGNESAPSPALEVTIDTTLPDAPATPTLQDDSNTGSLDDTITSINTPTFDVPCSEEGNIVTLYTDKPDRTKIGEGICSGGTVEIQADELPEGEQNITATETDLAGNEGPDSDPLVVTIDSEAPIDPVVDEPIDGGTVANPTLVTGTCLDAAGGTVTITSNPVGDLDPAEETFDVDEDGNYSGTVTWKETVDGTSSTLVITCTDPADNEGTSVEVDVTVDLSAPGVKIDKTAEQDDPTNNSTVEFIVEFLEEVVGFDNTHINTDASIGVNIDSITVVPRGDGKFFDVTFETTGEGTLIATIPEDSVSDLGGTFNSPSVSIDNEVVIDLTKPEAPGTPTLQDDSNTGSLDDNITSITEPIFDVPCAEEGNIVTLYTDNPPNTKIGEGVCAGGTVEIQADELAEGDHNITATETDEAGNVSDPSPALEVTIDTTLPEAPGTPLLQDDSNTGSLDDTITSIKQPTFDVECTTIGHAITLYTDTINRTPIGSDPCDTLGTVGITSTISLEEGEQNVTATETDLAGNEGPDSDPLVVVIDSEAPDVPTIDEPIGGSTVGNPTPFTGSCIDAPNGTVTVTTSPTGGLDPEESIFDVDEGGNFSGSLTWTEGADGSNQTLVVTCIDAAGNVGLPEEVDVTVDLGAPGITINHPGQDDPTNNPEITYTITFSEAIDPSTFEISDIDTTGGISATVDAITNTGDDKVFTVTVTANGEGTVIITIPENSVQDSGGNDNTPSFDDDSEVTVDTIKPVTPGTPLLQDDSNTGSLDDNITSITEPIFDVPCAEEGNIVTLYTDNPPNTKIGEGVCAGGTVEIQADELAEGDHNITATETDEAGNVSDPSPALEVTIDTTLPEAPGTPLLQDDSNTGSLDDTITSIKQPTFDVECTTIGHAITLYTDTINRTPIGSDPCDTLGTVGITSTISLEEGEQNVTATETDLAGNEGPDSDPLVVVIDLEVPEAPGTPLLQDDSNTGSLDDTITSINTPTFDVPCSEEGNIVTLYTDKPDRTKIGEGICSGGTVEITVDELPEGEQNITATETDEAGNESDPSPNLVVTIDTIAPGESGGSSPVIPDLQATSDTGVSPTDNITSITEPVFDITCLEAGSTITFYNGTDVIGTYLCGDVGEQEAKIGPLPEGDYNISIKETDIAGNEGPESGVLPVTIDTTPNQAQEPDLIAESDTGASKTDNVTDDTTPTFDVNCSAANIVITLYVDGNVHTAHTCAGTGTEQITLEELAEGAYDITVTETDLAGNEGPPSPSITITIISASIPIYRFWSDKYQSHFYTKSLQEKISVEELYPSFIWRYEGIDFKAFAESGPGRIPVYRFWSAQRSQHFYTVDSRERLVTSADPEWESEGIAWYLYAQDSQSATALYRFYSANYSSHFYTSSRAERDSVIATDPNWAYEGITAYVPR